MLSFESTARSVELFGASIHYNEAGDGPVLFGFHGGGPGGNAWDNTKRSIEALSKHFRVILMDLPGFSRSQHVEALEGEKREQLQARVILAFMDKLGIDKAHFYGTSMSGGPVIYFAHQHPERVLKLVLKSPPTGPNLLTMTPPDGIMALGVLAAEPTRENTEKMMRLFIPKPGLLTEALIEDRFAAVQRQVSLAPPKRAAVEGVNILEILPRLTMPVLVLWGHQDRMVPIDGALLALALIPDVRLHVWGGGTGHFIEFEHTQEFEDQVLSFLTR